MKVDFDKQYSTGEDNADTVLFDHIEIVRGATGLLSGSGRPSARINAVLKKADRIEPKTVIQAGYGNWNKLGVSIDHAQALNDSGSVRGRVIASYQGNQSYIDLDERKNITLYGSIGVDVGETGVFNAAVSYQKHNKKGIMWGGLPIFYTDGKLIDWPINTTTAPNWSRWHSKNLTVSADYSHTFSNGWTAQIKASHSGNSGEPKLVYWYGTIIDPNTGSGPVASALNYQKLTRNQNNLQAQLNGNYEAFGRTHDFTVGAELTNNKTYGKTRRGARSAIPNIFHWHGNSYPEPKWSATGVVIKDMKEKETGIYAATRLRANDELSFIIGTRWSNWQIRGTQFNRRLDADAKSVWTPYIGVVYDITPNHSLYASYTDIFQPQTERDINGKTLKPIRGKNQEIGLKSSFADGALQSQLSIYHIKQNNLAQPDGGKTIPGTTPPEPAYYPAQGATSNGFEIEINGHITPEWQMGVGYSQFSIKDADGKPINTWFPRKNFNLFTTYDASALVDGLTLGGGINWMSSKYRAVKNPAGIMQDITQDSVTLVDLLARYQINPQLSVQLNINNVFNEKYYSQIGMYGQNNYAPPRNAYASMRFEF